MVAAAQHVLRQRCARCLAGIREPTRTSACAPCTRPAAVIAVWWAGWPSLRADPVPHTLCRFGPDPYLLNCADGCWMRTQTLRPHDPAELCTRIVAWPYGSTDTSGAWQRHQSLPAQHRRAAAGTARPVAGSGRRRSRGEPAHLAWPGQERQVDYRAALTHGMARYGERAAPGLLVASKYERHPTERLTLLVPGSCSQRRSTTVAAGRGAGEGPHWRRRKQARFMRGDFFEFQQTSASSCWSTACPSSPAPMPAFRSAWRIPWTVRSPARSAGAETCRRRLVADGASMLRSIVYGLPSEGRTTVGARPGCWRAASASLPASGAPLSAFIGSRCEEKPFAGQESAAVQRLVPRRTPPAGRVRRRQSHFRETAERRGLGQEAGPTVAIACGKGYTFALPDSPTLPVDPRSPVTQLV